jgi:hypothetical protein
VEVWALEQFTQWGGSGHGAFLCSVLPQTKCATLSCAYKSLAMDALHRIWNPGVHRDLFVPNTYRGGQDGNFGCKEYGLRGNGLLSLFMISL